MFNFDVQSFYHRQSCPDHPGLPRDKFSTLAGEYLLAAKYLLVLENLVNIDEIALLHHHHRSHCEDQVLIYSLQFTYMPPNIFFSVTKRKMKLGRK